MPRKGERGQRTTFGLQRDAQIEELKQQVDQLRAQLNQNMSNSEGRLVGLERIRRDLPWRSSDQIALEGGASGAARRRFIPLIMTQEDNPQDILTHEWGGAAVLHTHFNDTAVENLIFQNVRLPDDAVPGQELEFVFRWEAVAESGDVVWAVDIDAFDSTADITNLGGGSPETAYAAPTVAGDTVETTIPKIAAPELGATLIIKLTRTGSSGDDDAVGDALVIAASLTYLAYT